MTIGERIDEALEIIAVVISGFIGLLINLIFGWRK